MNHTRVSIVITCSEYLGLLLFVLIKHKVEDLPFGMLGPRKFIGLTDFNWLLPILWRIRFLYANFPVLVECLNKGRQNEWSILIGSLNLVGLLAL